MRGCITEQRTMLVKVHGHDGRGVVVVLRHVFLSAVVQGAGCNACRLSAFEGIARWFGRLLTIRRD
jgi:hypothetical protein